MMQEIDLFANQVLEEARRFFEKAGEAKDATGKDANLHAALMLSFCALEAYVNAMGEEAAASFDLPVHGKGVLLEKEVKLEHGAFKLTPALRMARLEDRIEFLHVSVAAKEIDRSSSSWRGQLSAAITLRNKLTHARKEVPAINETDVQRAIEAIVATLDALFHALYNSGLPSANRGTLSRFNF
jgi:hypothetical protein